MKPPMPEDENTERLFAVLEEWQPQLEPAPGLIAALRRRIALHHHPAARRLWGWQTWTAAAATAAAALAMLVYWSRPQPVETPVVTVAVVQDLQLWNRNADLIENLDFLKSPATQRVVEEQN
jgi:hypothetical protein